jgi:hypothetical protein
VDAFIRGESSDRECRTIAIHKFFDRRPRKRREENSDLFRYDSRKPDKFEGTVPVFKLVQCVDDKDDSGSARR